MLFHFFEHAAARRQLEHLREARAQERAVLPAKGAERVVIGMGVRAQQPHRHVFIGRALDLMPPSGGTLRAGLRPVYLAPLGCRLENTPLA